MKRNVIRLKHSSLSLFPVVGLCFVCQVQYGYMQEDQNSLICTDEKKTRSQTTGTIHHFTASPCLTTLVYHLFLGQK